MNAEERARRLTDVERRAADTRIEIAMVAERARREAYIGWASTALQAISQVIAAEAQAAIGRSIVQTVSPFVGTALAGLGTFGSLGIGAAAIGGLQLLSSSFSNPVLDDATRYAGLREAQQLQTSTGSTAGRQAQYGEERPIETNINVTVEASGTRLGQANARESIKRERWGG